MNFTSFVALRYLQTSREQRSLSWITVLSIVGIAIGVATMIVVMAVMNGFEQELRSRFLAANAHVLMFSFPQGIKGHEFYEEEIRNLVGEQVRGTSPFVHAETMARNGRYIHSITLRGIDAIKRSSVQQLNRIVRPPGALLELAREQGTAKGQKHSLTEPSIIVGIHLLHNLEAQVGDTIQLISPAQDSSDAGLGAMQAFRVVGVYDSGLQHYDAKLGLISIPAAQSLFDMGNTVTGLEIGLNDPDRSREVARKLDREFNMSVKEWKSFNKNVFEAIKAERGVIGLIVALVAFVASFNIFTTLFATVNQKRRDISLFKSLGVSNRQMLQLFLKQSALIGLSGCILGTALAYLISMIIENFEIIDLPEIYMLARLPVEYNPLVYLGVAAAALSISCVAGLYPAWVATKVIPTEGLSDRAMNG